MTTELHRSSNAPELWDTIEAFEMDEPATYLYLHCPLRRRARDGEGSSRIARDNLSRRCGGGECILAGDHCRAAETYGSGPLEAALRDVQWVADVAMAHESVVEFFARQPGATVIPMKLFTMFSSDRRAASQTRSRLREIEAVVSRIAGCEEWGVRISHRPPAATRAPGRHTKSSSGTAFLAAKKAARDAARASADAAAEVADETYATLASIAREARRRHDAPQGATSPPLLDAAFLVPVTGRSRFKAAVKKLAADSGERTHVTLTGPWPSYNFIQPESNS